MPWKEKTMDRKEIAWRRLAELTDPEDRLNLILTADLGDDLIEMLPQLIDSRACSFEVYNTACDKFAMDGIELDHNGLYIWLEINLGAVCAPVNFAGLMQKYADADEATEIVEAIIKQKLDWGDYSSGLHVQMSYADVCAMRTYCPTSVKLDCVELSVVYHALKGPVGVDMAIKCIPGGHTTHRVPAEQQLVPVAEHLRSVGITQIVIDEMVELLFKEEAALVSLDKVVALAAIHEGSGSRTRTHLLRRQLVHILGLHFANNSLFARSTNMDWLFNNGLFNPLILESVGPARDAFDAAILRELAHGRLSAVFQFLFKFMSDQKNRKNPHRSVVHDRAYVESLLPAAFQLAMTDKRYGTAAAIAQICDAICEEDRIRSLELAIAYGERIRLESIFYRLE